ncbi:sodium/hydrogen exchanger 3-like [Gigantopelta aegis]|uniref:sodium/hydrogen exchanger 3-like n=1 Tax=Gigantopelta aegis TaxID=1735272 RepID=UPI001B88A7C0|nr:sodium/hydrogen exchanger 3-like [Gigantopelta aegis]
MVDHMRKCLIHGGVLAVALFSVCVTADGKSDNETVGRYQLVSFDFHHVEIPYVICLWVLLASVAKIGFHMYRRLSAHIPESCILIILGIITGAILHYSHAASTDQYILNANTFFLFLLPPIIYDAGYHMPIRSFFNNLGTILLLAFINTLWNTIAIGLALWGCSVVGWIQRPISLLHCFVFSALISAVDPVAVLAVFEEIQVNEMLYIIVFGESLLNDGVTVVVYHMLEGFTEMGEENILAVDIASAVGSFFIIALGGTLIGIVFGMIGGFITKYTEHVKVIEPIFVFVLGYLAYLSAEMLHWSGILALSFGGICMRHYVEANVSRKSKNTVKYFMKLLANICETVIFMFLGLSTVIDTHDWQLDFILFTVIFCIVFRVMGVVTLAFLVNQKRLVRLTGIDQFIMSYGGLRGGIAFCLALLLNEDIVPEKRMFVSTTIIVVFFTVFLQGITIKPVVNALKVQRASKRKPTMNERIHERLIDHLMAGMEDIVGRSSHNSIRDKFEYYNIKYLQPWLHRELPKTRERKIFEVFTKLNLKDAKDHIETHGNFMNPSMFVVSSSTHLVGQQSSTAVNEMNSTEDSSYGHKTVLDMRSADAVFTKKQADDSRIHHILEDSMFKPRRTFVRENHHSLSELKNHPPFHHQKRLQLRRLINESYHNKPLFQDGRLPNVMVEPEKTKVVSFFNAGFVDDTVTMTKENSPFEPPSISASDKVVFVLGDALDASQISSPPEPKEEQKEKVNETEAEKVLPWKRSSPLDPVSSLSCLTMPDDEHPIMSSRPSWASNPAYHHLTETGSPYASPQNTINADPPKDSHTSVFDVFQNGAAKTNDDDDNQDAIPDLPTPWSQCDGVDDEPMTSRAVDSMGDKSNNLLQSNHSFIPPAHHVIIPHDHDANMHKVASSLVGHAASTESPKHWQPFEVEGYKKKRLETEIMMEEMAYQEGVQSRVTEWLHDSDKNDDPVRKGGRLPQIQLTDDENITDDEDSDFDTHL